MSTITRTHPSTTAVRPARTRALGLVATVGAALGAWLIGAAAGTDYAIADPTGSAVIDPIATAGTTLVVGLLGWATLALLQRLTRVGTALWVGLAVLVTAASMVPVGLVVASGVTKVALVAIHLVVATALVPTLVRAR